MYLYGVIIYLSWTELILLFLIKDRYGYVSQSKNCSCDELFENGETVETPFDNLMAFTDATELWGLNESTLRKAISYGKLVTGIDACKYGKQWVISTEAMRREYGSPKVK